MNVICMTKTSGSWYYIHNSLYYVKSTFLPTSVTIIKATVQVLAERHHVWIIQVHVFGFSWV